MVKIATVSKSILKGSHTLSNPILKTEGGLLSDILFGPQSLSLRVASADVRPAAKGVQYKMHTLEGCLADST